MKNNGETKTSVPIKRLGYEYYLHFFKELLENEIVVSFFFFFFFFFKSPSLEVFPACGFSFLVLTSLPTPVQFPLTVENIIGYSYMLWVSLRGEQRL